MTGKTHMMVGGLAAMAVVTVTKEANLTAFGVGMASSVLGSLVPDCDHENSKFAHANIITRAISGVISSVTKHRGVCHTIPFCIVASLVWLGICMLIGDMLIPSLSKGINHLLGENIGDVSSYIYLSTLYFFVGTVSHLVADTFNPQGIMWGWPVSKKRMSVMSITTSGGGELIFSIIVSIIFCAWIVVYFNGIIRTGIPF